MPNYSENNPYQTNLIDGLERNNVETRLKTPDKPIIFSILRSVRKTDTDIVHLHWLKEFYQGDNIIETTIKSILFFLELAILRLAGYTIVWTVHNFSPHNSDGRFESIYYMLIIRLTSKIIVHSESGADAFSKEYNLSGRQRRKIDIIPHGHYLDNYPNEGDSETARENLGLDPDLPTFAFVGLIRPYKNVTGLIDAFAELEEKGHKAQLVIAGNPTDSDYEDAVEEHIDAAGSDRITYHQKFIPGDELQIYFNAADAVVLPFERSLTSGSAILSLSFERPVVIPRMGCLTDLDPGAIYYDSETESIYDGLERALDSDLKTLGTAGHELVSDYDWDMIGQKTRAAYETA